MTARLTHNQRSDARDNRGRILDAAHAVFVTGGLDVPIREIARHAEVGPATVYRHFTTKETLVAEAFAEQAIAWQSTMDQGLADPDPWRGFCRTVEELCVLQARDRGFSAAVKSTFPCAIDFAAMRASSLTSAAALIHRVKDTGRLRPDVVLDDLILMIMANNGIRGSTPAVRVAASRRFAGLMIQAFQAAPAADRFAPSGRRRTVNVEEEIDAQRGYGAVGRPGRIVANDDAECVVPRASRPGGGGLRDGRVAR